MQTLHRDQKSWGANRGEMGMFPDHRQGGNVPVGGTANPSGR